MSAYSDLILSHGPAGFWRLKERDPFARPPDEINPGKALYIPVSAEVDVRPGFMTDSAWSRFGGPVPIYGFGGFSNRFPTSLTFPAYQDPTPYYPTSMGTPWTFEMWIRSEMEVSTYSSVDLWSLMRTVGSAEYNLSRLQITGPGHPLGTHRLISTISYERTFGGGEEGGGWPEEDFGYMEYVDRHSTRSLAGERTYIAVTWEANIRKHYINGVLVDSWDDGGPYAIPPRTDPSWSGDQMIICSGRGAGDYQGRYQAPAWYLRALSASEIWQHWLVGNGPAPGTGGDQMFVIGFGP